MAGLHRYHGKNGKYLVVRRDGSVPDWPSFVLGAKDPAAPAALRAYTAAAEALGMDPQYVGDVRRLADEFDKHREKAGKGDPDANLHRKDHPRVIQAMESGILSLAPWTKEFPLDSTPPKPLGEGEVMPRRGGSDG